MSEQSVLPRIDIAVPAYNASEYMAATIESIRAQTYPNWHAWIVDDCSTDDTLEVARRLTEGDERFSVHQTDANSGPGAGRNYVIARAPGPYIAFLDADDVWTSEKLERQIEFIRSNEAVLTFTSYQKIDASGTVISPVIHAPARIEHKKLLLSNFLACSTVVMDLRKTGRELMPPIRKRQDHAYWLHLTKKGIAARGLDEPLLYYRVHPGSVSSNKLTAARYSWYLYRRIEKMGLVRSVYYFANYAIRGLLKFLR